MFIIIVVVFIIIILCINASKEEKRRAEAKRRYREKNTTTYVRYTQDSTSNHKNDSQNRNSDKSEKHFRSLDSDNIIIKANTSKSHEGLTNKVLFETPLKNKEEKITEQKKVFEEYNEAYEEPIITNATTNSDTKHFEILSNLGFSIVNQSLLSLIPNTLREIEKQLGTNVFHSPIELFQKIISSEKYDGMIKVDTTMRLITVELQIIDPLHPAFKEFYFNKNDTIDLSVILDYNKGAVDFLIYKQKTDYTSFKEIGNYLYNYPSMNINKFGITQFSYLQATKLCNMLLNTIHNTLDLETLFNNK